MEPIYIILIIIGVITLIILISRIYFKKEASKKTFSTKKKARVKIKTRVERIGDKGEYAVAKALGTNIPNEKYVLNDIIVTHYEKSTEIDHILLSKSGIFVIETKNFSGSIYGGEKDKEWIQVLANGHIKHTLYNPVLQNEGHIKFLKQILNINKGFVSIIVFPQADLTNVITKTQVGDILSMKKKIASYNKKLFTTNELNSMYNILNDFLVNPRITKTEHVKGINDRRKAIESGYCPLCGGDLVIRDGKNGQFYGCSNFPDCLFSCNIE